MRLLKPVKVLPHGLQHLLGGTKGKGVWPWGSGRSGSRRQVQNVFSVVFLVELLCAHRIENSVCCGDGFFRGRQRRNVDRECARDTQKKKQEEERKRRERDSHSQRKGRSTIAEEREKERERKETIELVKTEIERETDALTSLFLLFSVSISTVQSLSLPSTALIRH
jgi:hypothetical protein